MTSPSDGFDRITATVYRELRERARSFLARERRDHTLQTTALAHEAILRLRGDRGAREANEREYLLHASRAIRRILVDHARSRASQRRGGLHHEVPLDQAAPEVAPFDVCAVSDLLDELAAVDPTQARVVELRVFGGLTFAQIGDALGLSTGTAHGEWRMARAWILDRLADR